MRYSCAVVWETDGKTHIGFVGWNIENERAWVKVIKNEPYCQSRPMCIVRLKEIKVDRSK